jgi:hypothetical protein
MRLLPLEIAEVYQGNNCFEARILLVLIRKYMVLKVWSWPTAI